MANSETRVMQPLMKIIGRKSELHNKSAQRRIGRCFTESVNHITAQLTRQTIRKVTSVRSTSWRQDKMSN